MPAPGPLASAAYDGARDGRKNITIGEHNKARAQRGQHLILKPVGKIRCVVKLHGETAESVAGSCVFDTSPGQYRSGHAGVEYCVARRFQPGSQKRNMSRPAHAIGPLNHDQLSGVGLDLNARQRRAIKLHLLHLASTAFSLSFSFR